MPQAYITVDYPGASPEAIENDVIKPIENVINSVDGVKQHLRDGARRQRVPADRVPAGNRRRSRRRRRSATRSRRSARRCRAKCASRRSRAPATTARTEPVVSLVVYSTHAQPARSLDDRRSADRQAPAEFLRRRQRRRRRRGRAAGAGVPAAGAAAELPRRRRPGDRGDSRGEPGPAGRQHLARRERAAGARRRQDEGSARLRAHHRREPGRRAGVSAPGRRHRRRRGGRAVDLARRRHALGVARRVSRSQQANIVEVGKGVDEAIAELQGAPARRTSRSARCGRMRSGSKARSTASRKRSSRARCSRS